MRLSIAPDLRPPSHSFGRLRQLRTVFGHRSVRRALPYGNEALKLDYLWAALCIMGAVYFIFRG
jgi:uncharacterized protein (DUF486 family)